MSDESEDDNDNSDDELIQLVNINEKEDNRKLNTFLTTFQFKLFDLDLS